MGKKGFTNPLGIQTLPTGTYGSLLVRHGTDALNKTFPGAIWENTSYLTHAHHIVMRHGPKNAKAADAVAKSKAILRKWGIDIDSRENMVWAPNRGHTVDYAENVWLALQDADSRDEAITILQQLARDFIKV